MADAGADTGGPRDRDSAPRVCGSCGWFGPLAGPARRARADGGCDAPVPKHAAVMGSSGLVHSTDDARHCAAWKEIRGEK